MEKLRLPFHTSVDIPDSAGTSNQQNQATLVAERAVMLLSFL
jgi:hypothetical protein